MADEQAPDAAQAPPTAEGQGPPLSVAAAVPYNALRLLSRQGALCTGGSLREFVSKYQGVEGLVALNPGLPPDDCFPVQSLQLGLAGVPAPVQLDAAALLAAQQLGLAVKGYPPLRRWVAAHVAALHAPPAAHDVLITAGSSNGLELVASLFLDERDCLVAERFCYPQFLECQLAPRRCTVLSAPCDHDGLLPDALDELLAGAAASGLKPKLLYTVPTGQNPTGACAPLERKAAVFEVCRRHGLLILEDDAYQYLQFPQGAAHPPGLAGLPRGTSYLSLDADGRVIRLDTCTKFLAPGLRLGWAVAAPAVIEKMTNLLQGQALGPSGISQVVAHTLLEAWGEGGLDRHLSQLQSTYAAKAAALHQAALRELGGLAEWREPRAGMFMWVRLLDVEDATEIEAGLREARVVVVPGRLCHPRAADPAFKCPYVRIAFAHPPAEQLEEGVRRLASVLRDVRRNRRSLQQE